MARTGASKVRWFASAVEAEPPPEDHDASVKTSTNDGTASSELKTNLSPKDVVVQLDKHIVGQQDAKRAVAIAMRNRWRRKQLPEDLRKEVTPRNVLLVGPTGMSTFSSFVCFLGG